MFQYMLPLATLQHKIFHQMLASLCFMCVSVCRIRRDPFSHSDFLNKRLGKYSDDDSITSITEFTVQKHGTRHPVGKVSSSNKV